MSMALGGIDAVFTVVLSFGVWGVWIWGCSWFDWAYGDVWVEGCSRFYILRRLVLIEVSLKSEQPCPKPAVDLATLGLHPWHDFTF